MSPWSTTHLSWRMVVVGWSESAIQQPSQLITYSTCPVGWDRESEESKWERLVDQHKDSLVSEGKEGESDGKAVTPNFP